MNLFVKQNIFFKKLLYFRIISSASELVILTIPYRFVTCDLPFPRFGLKKPRHRSQKPYRFTVFIEKRLSHRNKKHRFPFLFSSPSRIAPNSLPLSVIATVFVKKREPYRTKLITVFRQDFIPQTLQF